MSILAGLGSQVATSLLMQSAASLTGPAQLRLQHIAGRAFNNDIPSASAILQSVNRGLITPANASFLLLDNNVDWIGSNPTNRDQSAWEVIRRLMLNVPGPSEALVGWAKGLLTDDETDKLIVRGGGSSEQWQWAKNLALAVPSADLAAQAFAREAITPQEYVEMLNRAGGRQTIWGDAIQAFYGSPSVGEAISLRNRNVIDDAEFDLLLRRQSLGRARDRELISRLRFTIPSISDLILMQVREAFSPELANRLGLYDESPKQIIPFLEAQGLNWEVGINGNVDGANRPLRWPDMYWAAHWKTISPEQAFRMFHLLRPNRIERYQALFPGAKPFLLDDLKFWLRIQDYPPAIREQLGAINFAPLRLIDIRNALRFKIRDADWAYEQFLDRGSLPDDARVQVDLVNETERQRLLAGARNLERQALSLTIRDALRGYKVGTIDRAAVADLLKANTVDASSIELVLNSIDFEVRTATSEAGVKLIRKRFMDGILGVDGVADELRRAGIVAGRIDSYVIRWRLERDQRYRLVTTAKIQRWAKMGFLTYDDARQRLINLGWSNADTVLYLSETQSEINQLTIRNLQSAQRTARQQAKDLQSIAERADSLLRRTQADLRRVSPVSTLVRWLKQGVVGEPFFVSRMRAMGYPDADITRYIRSAIGEEAEQQAQGNGQAGQPQGG